MIGVGRIAGGKASNTVGGVATATADCCPIPTRSVEGATADCCPITTRSVVGATGHRAEIASHYVWLRHSERTISAAAGNSQNSSLRRSKALGIKGVKKLLDKSVLFPQSSLG